MTRIDGIDFELSMSAPPAFAISGDSTSGVSEENVKTMFSLS